jgi:hypothetical protein
VRSSDQRRELPGGTHLAYYVYHESQWWSQLSDELRPNGGRRCVQVAASARGRGGGVRWEFSVVEVPDIGLKLSIFDDTWPAFQEIADFFRDLAVDRPSTLAEVVTLLERIGAVDETERPDQGAPASHPNAGDAP